MIIKEGIKLPKSIGNYNILILPSVIKSSNGANLESNQFLLVPMIVDFMRQAALTRGRLLFIETPESK